MRIGKIEKGSFVNELERWEGSLENRGKERVFLANRLKSGRTLK